MLKELIFSVSRCGDPPAGVLDEVNIHLTLMYEGCVRVSQQRWSQSVYLFCTSHCRFSFSFGFSHPESNSASFCFTGPRYFTDLCTQRASRASGVSWGPSQEVRSPTVTTGRPSTCLLCLRQAAPLDLKIYISCPQ